MVCLISFVYCILFGLTVVSSKTLLGLLDRLSFNQVPTDFAKIGEFCFTIPPGTRGVIDSEVVIQEEGHRLILLKDNDEKVVLSNSTLIKYDSRTRHRRLSATLSESLGLLRRRLSGGEVQAVEPETRFKLPQEAGTVHTPNSVTPDTPVTRGLTATTNTTETGTTTTTITLPVASEAKPSEAAIAPGVPRKEVFESHVHPGGFDGDVDHLQHRTVVPSPVNGLAVDSGVLGTPNEKDSSRSDANIVPPVLISEHPKSGQATTVCDALVDSARVTETLKPVGRLSSYHLVLRVEPVINQHRVSLFVTRCGADPKAEYRIQVKNPGSFLKRHFSCEDLGLVELYTIATGVGCLLLVPLRNVWTLLSHTRRDQPVIDVFFLGALSYFANLLFHLMHLYAYAFDGFGFPVFVFLGELADLVFVVCICVVVSWLISSGRASEAWMSLGASTPDTMEDSEDEQKSLHQVCWLHTPATTTNATTTFFSFSTLREALLQSVDSTSAAHILIALALSTLLVVFLDSMHSNSASVPLTPGWNISHFSWDGTGIGCLVYLSTLMYFGIRYLLAVRILKAIVSSSSAVPENSHGEANRARRRTALLSSLAWVTALPSLALFPFALFRSLQTQAILLFLNFIVLIAVGRCFVNKPESLVFDVLSHFHHRLPTSSTVKAEHSNLVVPSVVGGRRVKEHQHSLSGLAIPAPVFPAPAWDQQEDDNEDSHGSEEPDLLDTTQLRQQLPPASVFGYSTLG